MSYPCPRCGTTLIESDDEVDHFELEGDQVPHTQQRCATMRPFTIAPDVAASILRRTSED